MVQLNRPRAILIAGASRGIGYCIAQQYKGDRVFGFARNVPTDCKCFERFFAIDARCFNLTDMAEVANGPLDRLYLSFAVFGPKPPNELDLDVGDLNSTFAINCA